MLQAGLDHLKGCIERLETDNGKGLCFHRSMALLMDFKEGELVVGTTRAATKEELRTMPNASKVPFIHCWVEIGDAVFAPTTVERTGGKLVSFRRESYYEMNGSKVLGRLGYEDLMEVAQNTGLVGHLRYGLPMVDGISPPDLVLTRLKIPHGRTAMNTVVPYDSPEAVAFFNEEGVEVIK